MGVLPKLQEIVKLFRSVQEPKAKYQQLLFYSKNLKQLETQFKTRENKVDGCVSQDENSELKIGSGGGENSTGGLSSEVDVDENGTNSGGLGSRGMRIREKLEKELRPIELEAEDISYQHAGRAGGRGSDGETHFNVKIVSEKFKGKSLVKREIDLWFVTKVVGQWTSCIVDCREDTI
ncbi:hypothetical protein LWI28_013606 [Acer negundo]|uniref:Fe-S metabolism associated domain-containing protein n=1 Tax=Acer negundo TaxID=4023 RepID=A0AAD5IEY9_ACENE|nr:hypothetical protein LWI28_013606 [Acer negundo]